jgi:hypothetical protein
MSPRNAGPRTAVPSPLPKMMSTACPVPSWPSSVVRMSTLPSPSTPRSRIANRPSGAGFEVAIRPMRALASSPVPPDHGCLQRRAVCFGALSPRVTWSQRAAALASARKA